MYGSGSGKKISTGSGFLSRYDFIEILKEAVDIFGSQALVGMVDYKDGYVYFENGKLKSDYLLEKLKQTINFFSLLLIFFNASRKLLLFSTLNLFLTATL